MTTTATTSRAETEAPTIRLMFGNVPAEVTGGTEIEADHWYLEGLGEWDPDSKGTQPWHEHLGGDAVDAAIAWAARTIGKATEYEAVEGGWGLDLESRWAPTLMRRRHTLFVDTLDAREELAMKNRDDAEWNLRLLSDADAVLTFTNDKPAGGVWLEELHIPVRKVERVQHVVRLEPVR